MIKTIRQKKHEMLVDFTAHVGQSKRREAKRLRGERRRQWWAAKAAWWRGLFTWEIEEANSSDNSTIV